MHAFPFGETSTIFHCYTEEFGRITLMGKGIRKSKKNNRSNLLQPLFLLNLEIYFKDNSEIKLVKEISRSVPLNSIPENIVKSTQAIFLAEILYRGVREEHENRPLFTFLYNAVQYLDLIDRPDPNFHLVFLCLLSRYLGFYPKNNFSETNRLFDPVNGIFIREYNGITDSDITVNYLLSKMLESEGFVFKDSGMSRENRNKLLRLLLNFYEIHLEGMGNLKSVEVLTATFDSFSSGS